MESVTLPGNRLVQVIEMLFWLAVFVDCHKYMNMVIIVLIQPCSTSSIRLELPNFNQGLFSS